MDFTNISSKNIELAVKFLYNDRLPRLFVSHDLRVIWENRSAIELISSINQINISDGNLILSNKQDQNSLISLLNNSDLEKKIPMLPIPVQDGHLLISIDPMDFSSPAPIYSLSLISTEFSQATTYPHLEEIFGLTAAEYRTLARMLDGATADMLAERGGVSVETVRTHIRRIYTKLGVSSREGLFSRIRPYLIS